MEVKQLVMKKSIIQAILTDSHFWVPVVVLVFGVIVLLWLH